MNGERTIPGYWMNETSGVLRPAVEAYLTGSAMTVEQIAAMRAYLRQWMQADWRGPGVAKLRQAVDGIATRRDIKRWLDQALELWIDPL